jgi:chromosome partitioning protein
MYVSFMTEKGGAGKTTTALTLATALTSNGTSCTVLDCDPNQVAHNFYRRVQSARKTLGDAFLAGFTVIPRVTEENIYNIVDQQRDAADFLFYDLPGVGARLITYALARSQFVVVPMQASEPDMSCAVRSAKQIDDAGRMNTPSRVIARRYIWTRIPAAIVSKGLLHAEKLAEELKLPLFDTRVVDRAAMRDMFFTGIPPHLGPDGRPVDTNAALNARALATEFLQRLADLSQQNTGAAA